jgi:OmpA-OmpF porin, OOP family
MIKKWFVAMSGAAALALSTGALAQMAPTVPNFYVGLEVGQTDAENEEDTGFKLLGGYQFHRNIAAEIGYGLLFDKGGEELTSLEVTAVGLFPLANQFSLFGKLGFARVEAESNFGSTDDTSLTFGFGGQFDVNRNLGLRLGWQRYEIEDTDVDFISLGVLWRF